MSEDDIKIISKEDYQNEELSEQKIIFDNTIFEQIKGKELDLSVEKVLEIPTLRNWFKRQKEEYYVISQKEHIIDCKLPKDPKRKQIAEIIIDNDEYVQIEYIDYELSENDSIYEVSNIETENEEDNINLNNNETGEEI